MGVNLDFKEGYYAVKESKMPIWGTKNVNAFQDLLLLPFELQSAQSCIIWCLFEPNFVTSV